MHGLPDEFAPRRLVRRLGLIVALLAVLVLAALLTPGLEEVRSGSARPTPPGSRSGSCSRRSPAPRTSLMFRPVFCPRLSRRTTTEIALAELAVGSLIPASGASGLAFGAWILHRERMPGEQIARRSVAFLVIKSSVNFVAVAVIGTLMAVGLLGPHQSLWLTALPAALSVAFIAAVAAAPTLGPGEDPRAGASKLRRAAHTARPRSDRHPGGDRARPPPATGGARSARSATGRSTTRSCGRRSRRSAPTSR